MAFAVASLLLACVALAAPKDITEALAADEVCSLTGDCSVELLQVHGCAGKEATSDCSDVCASTVWKACKNPPMGSAGSDLECGDRLNKCLDHCSSKSCGRHSGSCWSACADMHSECYEKDWDSYGGCDYRLKTCMKDCNN